jgi:hypothetical protein
LKRKNKTTTEQINNAHHPIRTPNSDINTIIRRQYNNDVVEKPNV